MKKNIIILNSHPIQYFAPLYRELAKEDNISLTVYYCSDFSIKGNVDKQFGQTVKWDIPLLDGYKSVFLKNYSFSPSIYSFWGLLNFGILRVLMKAPKNSIVLVFGWAYFINFLTIALAKLMGYQTAIRGEAPLHFELQRKTSLSEKVRHLILKNLLFRFIDIFLYIGKQNKAFYQHFGVPETKLKFSPYCVDNARFSAFFQENATKKHLIKEAFGIPQHHTVILSSGKYITKKRPLDLIKAFKLIDRKDVSLIMVGDGELRKEMEDYIATHHLSNVVLTGFINQTQIPNYYTIADLYVMTSGIGETWGLSTNEAMNFELPIILSDQVGCAIDLVQHGENGFIYPAGDIQKLADYIKSFVGNPLFSEIAGKKTKKIINNYSYKQTVNIFVRL